MGNLIVENGSIRIPNIEHPVRIKLPQSSALDESSQKAIFIILENYWGASTGIKLKYEAIRLNDVANEKRNERWLQDIEIRSGKQSQRHEQSPLAEHATYIDFSRIEPGSAYQLTWRPKFTNAQASYITIDSNRRLLQADILHEFGHSLGLAHEHQRLDRDDYVEPQNRDYYQASRWEGQQIAANTSQQSVPFGPYDSNSIMHYPGVFKTHNNQNIGGTKDNVQFPNNLSIGDIFTARFLYNEARIRDHLGNNVNLQYGCCDRHQKEQYLLIQQQRLQALMPHDSNKHVVERTYDAVVNQLVQLKELSLIDAMGHDNKLLEWAAQNIRDYQQPKQPRQQKAARKTVGLFSQSRSGTGHCPDPQAKRPTNSR